MKYIKQFLIILLISFIGELIKYFVSLPIPASIYGIAIMFTCLMSGVIKYDSVKDTGKFLIEIMPVMFIPAGVGLMASWDVLQSILLPVLVIVPVTIVIVMAVTGWVSQLIMKKTGGK